MKMTGSAKRHAARERSAAAAQELSGLRRSLENAYSVFNSTSDPDLLEASILEIRALQSRYSRALRDLKNINGGS